MNVVSPAGVRLKYDPAATADGFDKLAAYGRVGGSFRWLVDTDNNGTANGTRFVTSVCSYSGNQFFTLQPVPGWRQMRF